MIAVGVIEDREERGALAESLDLSEDDSAFEVGID